MLASWSVSWERQKNTLFLSCTLPVPVPLYRYGKRSLRKQNKKGVGAGKRNPQLISIDLYNTVHCTGTILRNPVPVQVQLYS